jgi:hypothetical protein
MRISTMGKSVSWGVEVSLRRQDGGLTMQDYREYGEVTDQQWFTYVHACIQSTKAVASSLWETRHFP